MTSLLPDNLLDELNDLTFACLSGEASPEAIEHLNKLLLNSEPARRVYAHTIRDSFILRQWAAATELHTREMLGDDDSDAAFLRSAIADADLIATASSSNSCEDDPHTAAPVAAVPIPGFFSTAYHGTIGFFSHELPFALLIATVLTSLGLWAASMVYVSSPEKIAKDSSSLPSKTTFDPTLKVVGKITGMVDCKWADPQTETVNGANVLFGRKYALASGLMEITYHTGAKVILQGPVTYEVESNGGYLSVGKLTGKLEKKVAGGQWPVASKKGSGFRVQDTVAANHKSEIINHKSLGPAFAVQTPTATVTDLGTEFGVEVDEEGATTSHVFHGSVAIKALSIAGEAEAVACVLHENESARIENAGGNGSDSNRVVLLRSPQEPIDFVRTLAKLSIKTIDLVDVVAGGNGFSGRRNRGIDPTSGRLSKTAPPSDNFQLTTDGKYHRTTGLPFVDGVFIPDGRDGRSQQIDSAGHTFSTFGNSTGKTAHYIWAGGTVPVAPTDGTGAYPTTLNGLDTDFSSSGHGFLFMHANKGIAFDLEAIRRANPNYKLTRFRCVGGNAQPQGRFDYIADIWVFLDGKVRFSRRALTGWQGPQWIVIPLCDSDRFLTLAATDAGDGIGFDMTIFADPQIELQNVLR